MLDGGGHVEGCSGHSRLPQGRDASLGEPGKASAGWACWQIRFQGQG